MNWLADKIEQWPTAKLLPYARVMELDPRYCDVIVRRWQAFTGKRAVLEATGAPFPDEVPAVAA